jgi:hypothetical protein
MQIDSRCFGVGFGVGVSVSLHGTSIGCFTSNYVHGVQYQKEHTLTLNQSIIIHVPYTGS